ncbi:ABC transporter permease [Fibrella aquatilis]|uniref:ABC transporter permease n=1 Tax=Fibrella aquatilis TaxID=2817059 RepID=A0A939G8G6_9BACT|nr:FtsX-like permease family protein [Fibrella aquatilis]MBO0933796.1 ABC transporter permease [Fibrella aquatilis]
MNLPVFIASRVRNAPLGSFSATVTRVGIGSVAVGLAVLIIAFAVLFGFKRTIQQKIFAFGAHLQVVKFSNNQTFEAPPISIRDPAFERIQKLPGILHVQGTANKAGILQTDTDLAGVVLKGVGPDYDWQLIQSALVAGQLPRFDSAATSGYSTQLLISQTLASQLKLGVGQSAILYFTEQTPPRTDELAAQPAVMGLRPRKMTVVGIYETGLEEGDKAFVVGDLRLVQRLNKWAPDLVGTGEIFVRDFGQLGPNYKAVIEQTPPDMRVTRVDDQYSDLFDWMMLLDRNTAVFIVLILFVACFNMVSVLLVLMMERTPMIGLLKALGSANSLLRRLFVVVGLNIVAWGLLLGNGLGIGLCWLQSRFQFIPLDRKNYFMDYVPIAWDWPVIALLNAVIIILIALALWLPTLIINRIDPVKALVFKK